MNNLVNIFESNCLRDTEARKQFFLKYTAFDGCGNFYFNTLKEANKYALNRTRIINNSLNFSLSQYHVISKYYIDNLIQLKSYNYKSVQVNEYLQDCLITIKYLTSSRCKNEYVLSKVIYLLERYKYVTELLNYPLLEKLVSKYLNTLKIDYPIFRSSDYQEVKQQKNIKNERVKKVHHAIA